MKLLRKRKRWRAFSLAPYLKIVATLFGKFPLGARQKMGRSLGFIFSLIPTRDRLVCKLQLELAFKTDSSSLLRKVYQNIGETIFVGLNLDPILNNHQAVIRTQGWDEVVALLEKGKGLVALTSHTASWDLLAAYATKRGLSLYAIGRVAQGAAFQETLEHLREKHKINTIWRGGSSGIREIKELLSKNSIVAALIDQDTRVAGTFSQFFFDKAHTPTTLINIAKELETPICTAFIFKEAPSGYRVLVSPIDSSLTTQQICEEYNRRLQEAISHNPEQWVWIHKRWRTQPSGKRLSSSEYIEYLTNRCRTLKS